MTDDRPGGEAGEHRGADLAGVGPGKLVVDVLGAQRDVAAGRLGGQRVADRGEAHERRAEDPDDAGLVRSAGDRDGQLAGVRRGGLHLPVAGDDDGPHRRNHARGRSPRWPGP